MLSVSHRTRLLLPRLAVGVCAGALAIGSFTRCETTQEKAAKHQAESERILGARAKRQAQKKKAKKKNGKGDEKSRNGGRKQ